MQRALAQAQLALLHADPNPRVGCAIFSPDGELLGQGHTQAVGHAHAEVMALRSARAAGFDVRGASVFVTLEPCSHFGRTPPCCDALIEAGVAHVVVALQDPNPLVAGQGIARLRSAGITVDVLGPEHPSAVISRQLNIGFFSRMERGRPWVRLKVAASLDGKTALPDGQSQWITAEAARTDGHAWRARASAVLTGIGTVLRDQPRLDVRLVQTQRQPHVVVVDSRLQIPLDAPLLSPESSGSNAHPTQRQVFIYSAQTNPVKESALRDRGVHVCCLPQEDSAGQSSPKVDLNAMLRDLAQREVNELHVEAGHTLNGALIQRGLADELLLYLAPTLLGHGTGIAQLEPLATLGESHVLEFSGAQPIGSDLRIMARFRHRTHTS